MSRLTISIRFLSVAALMTAAAAANTATLHVNCGGNEGLTTIGAAIKILQHSEQSGPNTINVSGSCKENVVVVRDPATGGFEFQNPPNIVYFSVDKISLHRCENSFPWIAAGAPWPDEVECED